MSIEKLTETLEEIKEIYTRALAISPSNYRSTYFTKVCDVLGMINFYRNRGYDERRLTAAAKQLLDNIGLQRSIKVTKAFIDRYSDPL